MDKLLNENKEPQDIVQRTNDFEDGVEVNIDLKDLYANKKKTSKKIAFKKMHELHTESMLLDINSVRDVVVSKNGLEFSEEPEEDSFESLDLFEYNDKIDLSDLIEFSQED